MSMGLTRVAPCPMRDHTESKSQAVPRVTQVLLRGMAPKVLSSLPLT